MSPRARGARKKTKSVRARFASRGRSKYGAVRTTIDNITFASKKEARRYQELQLLVRARKIDTLTLQPEFVLSVERQGKVFVIGKYRGDFMYWESKRNGALEWAEEIVEDAKGFKTPLYRWKKKHFEAQYGIAIREV